MEPPNKKLKLWLACYIFDELNTSCESENILFAAVLNSLGLVTSSPFYEFLSNFREDHFRPPMFYENWVTKYIEYDFFILFRMGRSTFEKLCSLVAKIKMEYLPSNSHSGGRPEVNMEKSLLIILWYLGKGETIASISDRFDVTLSTVHLIITNYLQYLIKLMRQMIKWPDKQERPLIAEQFKNLAGFPGVIGAIDGCHIRIKVSPDQIDSYTNRKFFQSINLQGISTAKRLFTNIFVGFPGSAHDARVFKNSSLYQKVEQEGEEKFFATSYCLVGDSAYPLKTWCLTPYEDRGRLSRKEKKYNYLLSATRVVIEQAFGLLKGRWRILKYINVHSTVRAINIVTVCCILHNFCLINNDNFTLETEEEEEGNNASDIVPFRASQSNWLAKKRRETICNSFQ